MSKTNYFIGIKDSDQSKFEIPDTLLTTHTVVLGASGSGKTVVCKSIVEEALFHGVPVIAIDPKGDIGGLGISFGDFDPSDENIRVHAQIDAKDQNKDLDDYLQSLLSLYQVNLAKFYGEDEYREKIKTYTERVLPIIISPKNPAGLQLSSIPEFSKPDNYKKLLAEAPDAILSSLDLKISLLLRRCGIHAEGSTDSNIVFLNHLVRHYWEKSKKKVVTLADLIEGISDPPFDKIGAISVNRFIKKKAREELISRINALMVRAVPGIKLDFEVMINLVKKMKKTPLIVFDLRKITDEEEKTLFVAEVLEELQRWIWKKGGTSQLRAMLYFDELYGFMPAGTVKPASKTALLLLLKQARAGGLGILLATQNPGDLDYRGLSNIATWFLGRLTSNQDIAKVEAALKAVFEGSGGSPEDFKRLMSSMRALKPGEFISYSPKLGVNKLKTRWLFSYHKGPLVDPEIKHLNRHISSQIDKLMPKSLLKEKKDDEESEQTESTEAAEEAISESGIPVQLKLVNKKPSVERLEERYIKKTIALEESSLLSLLRHRVGTSVSKDISFVINSFTPYYSPLLYVAVELNLKRELDLLQNEKIPLEIQQTIERVYDLAQSEINWDSRSVEGIFPSALGPQDLAPLADVEVKKFAEPPKELIKTLTSQIIWTLTQTPILEAKDIYYETLESYERSLVQKLGGKNKQQIEKLSTQTSRLLKQIEDIQEKISGLQKKLELVKADKINRQKENRSVKAQERSIESINNQIEKLTEKLQQLKEKVEQISKEREELIIEHKEMLQSTISKLDELKRAGPSGDLYRATKKDLSLSEKIIFWVPRVLIDFTVKKEQEGINETHSVNLNLYNGNGIIFCQSCNPKVAEFDYWEEILLTEISPPVYICSECLTLNCSVHSRQCQFCSINLCVEHANQCKLCDNVSCADHSKRCALCNEFVCSDHYWLCNSCQRPFCIDEPGTICELCGEKNCEEHSGKSYFTSCRICKKSGHTTHFVKCGVCKKHSCEEHMMQCSTCGKLTCPNCRQEFHVGKEKIIVKCQNCI